MYGFMLYCICSVTHHRVRMWYLIRGIDVLFPFKCGLASKAGLRHLSWNNSGSSATGIVAHLETKGCTDLKRKRPISP
jgi:hypothetical protein